MISFFGPFTWVSVPCVIQNQKWNYFIYRTYSDQFEWRHVIVLVHVSRKLMFVDVYLYRWIQTDISAAQELRADPDGSWPGRLFNNVIYYWVWFDNNSTTKPCSYCQHTKLNCKCSLFLKHNKLLYFNSNKMTIRSTFTATAITII